MRRFVRAGIPEAYRKQAAEIDGYLWQFPDIHRSRKIKRFNDEVSAGNSRKTREIRISYLTWKGSVVRSHYRPPPNAPDRLSNWLRFVVRGRDSTAPTLPRGPNPSSGAAFATAPRRPLPFSSMQLYGAILNCNEFGAIKNGICRCRISTTRTLYLVDSRCRLSIQFLLLR